jgi:hypothetical protein
MPKAAIKSDSLALLIDEYGELKDALHAVEDKRLRAEIVRAMILSKVGAFPDDAAKTVEGAAYSCDIAARKLENTVNCSKAFRKLGALQFLSICKVSATALRSLLCGMDAEKLIETERTGPRVLTVTRKADLSL